MPHDHTEPLHSMARPLSAEAVLVGFFSRTLTHEQWTHEAHLTVCWYAVRLFGPDRAGDFMRDAITSFNVSIGVINTTTSGYHETLTRYYTSAVADADALSPVALFDHPSCSRDAPLTHWSRALLFSTEARLGWAEPDLGPLVTSGGLLDG